MRSETFVDFFCFAITIKKPYFWHLWCFSFNKNSQKRITDGRTSLRNMLDLMIIGNAAVETRWKMRFFSFTVCFCWGGNGNSVQKMKVLTKQSVWRGVKTGVYVQQETNQTLELNFILFLHLKHLRSRTTGWLRPRPCWQHHWLALQQKVGGVGGAEFTQSNVGEVGVEGARREGQRSHGERKKKKKNTEVCLCWTGSRGRWSL